MQSWATASELLLAPANTLPTLVVFDEQCSWSNASTTAPTSAQISLSFRNHAILFAAREHGDSLSLPDGRSVRVGVMAFTSVLPDGRTPYFALALPSVWRASPAGSGDPRIAEFVAAVAVHELAHTLQLPAVLDRVDSLKRAGVAVPEDLSDDIIEEQFASDSAFRAAYEGERALYFEAAFAMDTSEARAFARRALELTRQRQERFYVGKYAGFGELESLFLNLEGVGTWLSYTMARRYADRFAINERTIERRGRNTAWVQGTGLAITITLDRLAPGWQRAALSSALASPYDQLQAAAGR